MPFCKCRCIYCDFYSTTLGEEFRKKFVETLCDELSYRKDYLPNRLIKTVYFGGGTPSQLSVCEIRTIIDRIHSTYDVAQDAEITFEANPDDVTTELVSELIDLGINRVSLGVQTFNDALLKLLHRRHTAAQARKAVYLLKNGGFENISIDLIYGLPQQTLNMFEADLADAFSLPITHLSSYALSIEEGTVLHKMVKNNKLQIADEDSFVAEYDALMKAASNAGFEHYEISNFALPEYYSRHNSAYWDGTPYLGCGPGAHSYDGKSRRYNLPDINAYISQHPVIPHETESLSPEAQFNERVFTSLRTQKGLDLERLKKDFAPNWYENLVAEAQRHLEGGRLNYNGHFIALTQKGYFVSDDVMSDLMI